MMHHSDEMQAVQNMIRLAKRGSSDALNDLVDFARVAPHWCFAEIANALADLLTTNGTSSIQIAKIDSLRGTLIYSVIGQEASINRLTSRARLGDIKAVYDLVELAKSGRYDSHPKVIEALVNISASKTARREHRVALESLRGHRIFETIAEGLRERGLVNIMCAAKSGDHAALQDLVRLAESRTFIEDARIVAILADIFLSEGADRTDKSLIWTLRDQVMYSVYVQDSEHSWKFVQEGEEGGWVDDGPTGHTESYTLWRYLQEYRGAQLEQWLARERGNR